MLVCGDFLSSGVSVFENVSLFEDAFVFGGVFSSCIKLTGAPSGASAKAIKHLRVFFPLQHRMLQHCHCWQKYFQHECSQWLATIDQCCAFWFGRLLHLSPWIISSLLLKIDQMHPIPIKSPLSHWCYVDLLLRLQREMKIKINIRMPSKMDDF